MAAMLVLHAVLFALIVWFRTANGGWMTFMLVLNGVLPLSLLLHYAGTSAILVASGYRKEVFAGVVSTSAALALSALLAPDFGDSGPPYALLSLVQDPGKGWMLAAVTLYGFSMAFDAAFLLLAGVIRLLSRRQAGGEVTTSDSRGPPVTRGATSGDA